MLSRDADSCFWIGRYVERAEATARLVDVHYHFNLERPLAAEGMRWRSILALSGEAEGFHARYGSEDERSIIQFFAFDEEFPDSIRSCLNMARENARSIREQLSSEMWESLNRTWLDMRAWNVNQVVDRSPHEFFQWVKSASHLFQGIMNRTLMMGESRDFIDSGRFLERAAQTARILDVKYHDLLPRLDPLAAQTRSQTQSQSQSLAAAISPEPKPPAGVPDPIGVGGPLDLHGWIAVLKSVGAYEAFRKTYHQGVTPTRVVDFLVLNAQFPASVRHSIRRVEGCLRRVSGNGGAEPANNAERVIGRLSFDLNYVSAAEIVASGLHEFLEGVMERCDDIGTAIRETYLTY